MKKALLYSMILVAGLSLPALSWAQTGTDAGKPQNTCPVLEGNKINKSIYADYQGKRIYFCSPSCGNEFKKNPEKYIKKLESQGVTLPSIGSQ